MSQTPSLCLAHFPLTGDGKKNRRKLKFVDQANNNFIIKAKAVLAGKTEREINLVLPISRQKYNHWKVGLSNAWQLLGKIKAITVNVSPSIFLP